MRSALQEFFQDFKRHAPTYIARNSYRTVAEEDLEFLWGYYEHVVFGASEGRDEPVSVSIQSA